MAVALMCNAKKGLSAKQMERDMGVSYKTAWYLNHRIRKAMDEGNGDCSPVLLRQMRRSLGAGMIDGVNVAHTISRHYSERFNARQKRTTPKSAHSLSVS